MGRGPRCGVLQSEDLIESANLFEFDRPCLYIVKNRAGERMLEWLIGLLIEARPCLPLFSQKFLYGFFHNNAPAGFSCVPYVISAGDYRDAAALFYDFVTLLQDKILGHPVKCLSNNNGGNLCANCVGQSLSRPLHPPYIPIGFFLLHCPFAFVHHFLRWIDGDDLQSSSSQWNGQSPGAAAQVDNGLPGTQTVALQKMIEQLRRVKRAIPVVIPTRRSK